MYVMHLMRSSWNKLFTSYLVYFQASSRWAIFVMFLEKVAILPPFGSKFTGFWRHLKELYCKN